MMFQRSPLRSMHTADPRWVTLKISYAVREHFVNFGVSLAILTLEGWVWRSTTQPRTKKNKNAWKEKGKRKEKAIRRDSWREGPLLASLFGFVCLILTGCETWLLGTS
jgi:hypothetical protein